MAFPDLSAITAVAAVPVAAPLAAISAQHDGAQGRARQYARIARSAKPAGAGTHAAQADTAHISVEGLDAELQSIRSDIAALAAAGYEDPHGRKRLAALAAQAAVVEAEIIEARRLAGRAAQAEG